MRSKTYLQTSGRATVEWDSEMIEEFMEVMSDKELNQMYDHVARGDVTGIRYDGIELQFP